jgi:uncharacterized protein (DUF362 family)
MSEIKRRDFLRHSLLAAAAAGLAASGCAPQSTPTESAQQPTTASSTAAPVENTPAAQQPDPASPTATAAPATVAPAPTSGEAAMAVMHGADPAAITKAAVAALGGIERFVKSGQSVIIKPNICVDYHTPEYAATTNPVVVATLVQLCLSAGAKSVRVMDMPFGGTPESAYAISGIGDAVKAAGGEMVVMSPLKFKKFDIPKGKNLKDYRLYSDILNTDVVINVPIAKHHSLAVLTLSIKNLFGIAYDPNTLHANLGQRAADILSLVQPKLTIIDAVRILMNNGPTGGDLNDVKQTNTIIASADPVAADSYGATLFGYKGADISYIQAAADMGLGTMDLKSIKIAESNL